MDKIYYSTNPTLINKDDFNGNHGHGWENIETTGEDLFEVLCFEGWAVSTQLKSEWRVLHQFSKTNLIMVDIDYGLSLDDALNHPIYKEYGYGYYLTATHTQQAHRFRLLFITNNIIADAKNVSKLRNALNDIFGGDKQCKDAVRLFYGNNNQLSDNKYPLCGINEKYLNNDAVAVLLDFAETIDEKVPTKTTTYITYSSHTSSFKTRYIVEQLKKVDLSKYETWFRVACGMKSAGFDVADFIQVSSCPEKDCKKTWDSIGSYSGNKITEGTLWHMIGGRDNYYRWRLSD